MKIILSDDGNEIVMGFKIWWCEFLRRSSSIHFESWVRSFVVVVMEPEFELVSNIFEIIRWLDASPVKFSLHRLVKSLDLSIVFWGIWRIDNMSDSIVFKTRPEFFRIKLVVCSDDLNSSGEYFHEMMNEIYRILDGIRFIQISQYESWTIIDSIKWNYFSFSSERKARIKLKFCSRFIVCIKFRIFFVSWVILSVSNLSSLEDSPYGCWIQSDIHLSFKFPCKWHRTKMRITPSKILGFYFNPIRSSIIRTSTFWSWFPWNETWYSFSLVSSDKTQEGFFMYTHIRSCLQWRGSLNEILLYNVFFHGT